MANNYYKNKTLIIVNPKVENKYDKFNTLNESYDKYMSKINEYIKNLDDNNSMLEYCEKIYIESDEIYEIPSIISNFKNVKLLILQGNSYGWSHIDCKVIPQSIEILKVYTNKLYPSVFINIDYLTNLTELVFNIEFIFYDIRYKIYSETGLSEYLSLKNNIYGDCILQLKDIPSLKKIHLDLDTMIFGNTITVYNYNIIVNNNFFTNIKYRINKIYVNNISFNYIGSVKDNNKYITIELN